MLVKRSYQRGRRSPQAYRECVAELEEALKWNPEQRERIYRTLVLAHHDQGRQFEALEALSRVFRTTLPYCDEEFDRLYLKALAATGTNPIPFARRERFFSLIQELKTSGEGDTVECGCFRGLSSYLICNYSGAHHVFDSFEGLSEPGPEDAYTGTDERFARMSQAGRFAAPLQDVKRALAGFNVEYYHGWIPQSFAGLPERRYRFVHLDLDLYAPTKAALEYFGSRCNKIVCDDYNWPGAKKAVDDFCAANGAKLRLTGFNQAVIE